MTETYRLGIDIGSTTVKVAILDQDNHLIFADYRRHFANIQETLADLLEEAREAHGDLSSRIVVTGSGGLTLAKHMGQPFCQEVVAVASALKENYPMTDVAIELGGEDAKIIYFKGGIDQRMNGICAGGTGSFIDQMASLLDTDAAGLNELAKNFQMIYPIAARCGVFAKTDIQPLINEGAAREDLADFRIGTGKAHPRSCCLPRRPSPLYAGASEQLYPHLKANRRGDNQSGELPPLRSYGLRLECRGKKCACPPL